MSWSRGASASGPGNPSASFQLRYYSMSGTNKLDKEWKSVKELSKNLKTTCHSKAHNDHSDHNDHDDGRALEVTKLNIQPLQKKSQQIRWCYVGTVTWYIPLHFPTMKLLGLLQAWHGSIHFSSKFEGRISVRRSDSAVCVCVRFCGFTRWNWWKIWFSLGASFGRDDFLMFEPSATWNWCVYRTKLSHSVI